MLNTSIEKVYHVITPVEFARLLQKRRVKLAEHVIVEPKVDGYLLVCRPSGLYTVIGRRAPKWMKAALFYSGVAQGVYEALKDGFVLFIELFGRRLTPHGYHRRHHRDYDAIVVEVGDVEDGRVRVLPPERARIVAEYYGLPYIPFRHVSSDILSNPPYSMARLLPEFRGWEGYIAKLYAEHGHKLPREYRAVSMGLLAVKARWESLGRYLGKG